MEKTSWKFYVERTGRSLSSIVGSAKTVAEAKEILSQKELTCPSDDVLNAIIENSIREAEEKSQSEKSKNDKYFRRVVATKSKKSS